MLVYTAVPTKKSKKTRKVAKERAPRKAFVAKKAPAPVYRARGTEHIPSHDLNKVPARIERPVWYYGEMAEREAAAQEIIERRANEVRNTFRRGSVAAIYISEG